MNLQYLKSFYVTVNLNSISKAAKQLHLTQPGLSMQLQALEKELDSNLLTRSNKGVELTEAGKILFDYADTILSIQDNIQRDLNNFKTAKKEMFLGSCKSIGEYALPCSIYVFKHEHPEININFNIYNTEEVIKNLSEKSINLGIVQEIEEVEGINIEPIAENPLMLVSSLPMIEKEISREEFRKLPIIIREKGSGTRKAVEKALVSLELELGDLNIMYEMNSMEGIKSSVMAGKGLAFIPELTIKRELYDKSLKEVKVKDLNISSTYAIAFRKGQTLSPYESQFKKFLKSSKRGFC